jgi:ABC transporter with metal-binding/Fe-S-binding domain ATP-binding protein
MRTIALVSGGKDSWYSLYILLQQGFEIVCTVTFSPRNPESYMLHSIKTQLVKKQSELANIKNYTFEVSGEKEKEVEEMKEWLKKIKDLEKAEALVCGAIMSEYQRHRIDMIAEELGLVSYTPLWHKNEEKLLKEIVQSGFKFQVVLTAAEGIERWKNQIISEKNVKEFIKDLKKARANVSGEGGEYETLVIESPLFKLQSF